MSSLDEDERPRVGKVDSTGGLGLALLYRECDPVKSKSSGPPLPKIYTLQGPWKTLYLGEPSFQRSILVQLDFIEFNPHIGFPELQRPDESGYDIEIYWQDLDDLMDSGFCPAHSADLRIYWCKEENTDFNDDTQWIWLKGPILAPKRVGKFKLMFKISRRNGRGLEAWEYAEEPLQAGHFQKGDKKDYGQVLDDANWKQLVKRRRDQAGDRKYQTYSTMQLISYQSPH